MILACFLFCTNDAVAQKKITQGKAIFNITFPESEFDQQTLATMPSESVTYFKDQHSRDEMKIAMGTTVTITDGKTGEMISLMDMMGNKIAMKFTRGDQERSSLKSGNQKHEMKITGETKMIAGFKCKKALMKFNDAHNGEINSEVWYTNEISAPNSFGSGAMNLDGIDGFLMEYNTKMKSMTMKMICRSVEETIVPDTLFIIPPGYTLTTMDELMKMDGMH